MAVVVPFRPRPRPSRIASGAAREGTILFFTGVRYERVPDTAEPSARPVRRRPTPRPSRSRQPA